MSFQNKVVMVTGSASGIRLATAKRFAKEGAKIVLADINGDRLKEAGTEVRSAGAADVWASVCYVSNEQDVKATVSGTIKNLGGFDVGLIAEAKKRTEADAELYQPCRHKTHVMGTPDCVTRNLTAIRYTKYKSFIIEVTGLAVST